MSALFEFGLAGGLSIVEDSNLIESYEDWSRVRSPARARRRMRYGFRQNIETRHKPSKDVYRVGNKLVMRPEMAKELQRQLAARADEVIRQETERVMRWGGLSDLFRVDVP